MEKNMVTILNFSENVGDFQYYKESFKCYLINTKSIPNFMNILEKSGILNNYANDKDKYINLNNLKTLLENYEVEKDIKLFSSYHEINFSDEFIFATEGFLEYIGYKNYIKDVKLKIVEVNIDYRLNFFDYDVGLEPIFFNEIKNGIYKFISYEEKLFNYYKNYGDVTRKNEVNDDINKNIENILTSKCEIKSSKIFVLNCDKIGCKGSETLDIYKNSTKLYTIKNDKIWSIIDVIELDNNHLIILLNDEIQIYKLSDQNYILFQTINIDKDKENYSLKNKPIIENHNNEMERRYYIQNPVPIACPSPRGGFSYKIVGLKKLKGNRFISISNCGFKIYSLKNNSQYSYDLLNELYYNITEIYEINNDEIIIISHRYIDENNKNNNRTNTNINFQPCIGLMPFGLPLGMPPQIPYNQPMDNSMYNSSRFTPFAKYQKPISKYLDYYDLFIDKFNISKNKFEKNIYWEGKINSFDFSSITRKPGYIILKNKYFVIMKYGRLIVIDLDKGIIINQFRDIINDLTKFSFGVNNMSNTIIKLKNFKNDNVFMVNFENNFFVIELTTKNKKEFNNSKDSNIDKNKEHSSNYNELYQISKNLVNALIVIPFDDLKEDVELTIFKNLTFEKGDKHLKFEQINDLSSQFNFYQIQYDVGSSIIFY